MITPEQLEAMAENLIKIYQDIEDDLLANIAGRLSVLDEVPQDSIAQWQLNKLRQLGALRKENYKVIAARSGKTLRENQALDFDERIYQMALSAGLLPAAPVPVNASPGVKRLIRAAIDNTRGYMNLVNTTALEASNKAFIDAVNQVYLEASLGMTDYNTSVRNAVRKLADQGITGATYVTQAGRVIRNHLDVAVKRALITSARQTTGQLKIQRAREWGSNLVEVSSHIGARPEHAVWQGRIYSIDGGTAEYPNLAAATGYGTVTGLKGANCAHDFWPFFEGLSEQTHFPVDETENARVYEQSQIQRKMEREIREQKRRAVAFEAAGDKEGLLAAQLKLKSKEAELRGFLGRTGRARLRDREQVLGFGRSQASKAVWAQRKEVQSRANFASRLDIQPTNGYNTRTQTIQQLRIPQIPSSDITKKIAAGEYSTKLSHQQYLKHVGGTVQYNKYKASRAAKGGNPQSVLLISEAEAQMLIEQKAGTGIVKVNRKGEPTPLEYIRTDRVIGQYYGGGKYHSTSKAAIHYGKKGAHIVPIKGDFYD